MRLKRRICQIMAIAMALLCSGSFVQSYAAQNDGVGILLLTDCELENDTLDAMNSKLFANDATNEIDYDYVLVDTQYINQFRFEKLDGWMEQGVTLVYSFDDCQEAEGYLQNNIDENIKLFIKGCEMRGIFLNKENGVYSVGTIANAEFVPEGDTSVQQLFVSKEYDKMEYLQGVIRNDLSNIDFSYQPEVKSSTENAKMPPSNSDRHYYGLCTCSKADGTFLGTLSITEYVYDAASFVNSSTGKTNKVFDVISSFSIAPSSDYSVYGFTTRMSCNQENEICIDQTGLPSDSSFSNSLSGGTGGIEGGHTYNTNTNGMTVTNSFSRLKEKDWIVKAESPTKGNALMIEPGIRVQNIDAVGLSGVGSYFMKASFKGILVWTYEGEELLFVGGQW